MNAKKCKHLRKMALGFEEAAPIVTTRKRFYRDIDGSMKVCFIVNPIKYPEGSRRRFYQDMKAHYVW